MQRTEQHRASDEQHLAREKRARKGQLMMLVLDDVELLRVSRKIVSKERRLREEVSWPAGSRHFRWVHDRSVPSELPKRFGDFDVNFRRAETTRDGR
jgi:hypothetical protein